MVYYVTAFLAMLIGVKTRENKTGKQTKERKQNFTKARSTDPQFLIITGIKGYISEEDKNMTFMQINRTYIKDFM